MKKNYQFFCNNGKRKIFFAPCTLITTRKDKKKILKKNIGPPSSIIAKTNTKRKPNFFVTFCILLLQENTMSRLKAILSPRIPFEVRKHRKNQKNSCTSYPS
jgi:hypothetical protein